MRVAFCIDNLNVGGTELNAVRTAERLRDRGVDVRVFCLCESGPLLERYEELGIAVHKLPIPRLYGARAFAQGRRFLEMLRGQQVAVVHAHDLYSNIFAAPWARLAGVGLLTSRRWLAGPARRMQWLANRHAYALSGRVLANSPAIGLHLVRRERVPARKVVVIPNFIETAAFDPPPPGWVGAMREQLDLSGDELVVGVLASLRPVKDHATLLQAVALLAGSRPSLHVVLVGADYGLRARLEAQIADTPLAGRVRFAGLMPSRPSPHHIFDISALTSRSEGFPNSILEAMASARPVLATRVGGIPDVVVDGETGLLVEAGDSEAMAVQLGRLVDDAALRRRFGRAGRARAESGYSADAAMDALIGVYESLSTSRAPGR